MWRVNAWQTKLLDQALLGEVLGRGLEELGLRWSEACLRTVATTMDNSVAGFAGRGVLIAL
jgi:hypothetical protein